MPDESPDGWYRELSIRFKDGETVWLHIERKPTGTHIPLLREKKEAWTKLAFHKCPCCPLPDLISRCPAAISLQTTLSKLRAKKSTERVKATAVDAEGHSQTVDWPLQDVGATLVQLAVFASGCPVGHRLKPYLEGLPPFVDSLVLTRRIVTVILEKHGGLMDASRQELLESVAPLRQVFTHLLERFRADERSRGMEAQVTLEAPRDAVPNSIIQVDAFAQHMAFQADKLLSRLSVELGWTSGRSSGGVWQRVKRLFG